MNAPPGFLFLDATRDCDRDGLVARVPAGTRGKRELLHRLAKQLHFPRYFGCNWDALEECLRDLSWLQERRIVILHEALPLRDPAQRRIYMHVLRDAIAAWRPGDAHELIAVFPASSRAWATAILEDQSAG